MRITDVFDHTQSKQHFNSKSGYQAKYTVLFRFKISAKQQQKFHTTHEKLDNDDDAIVTTFIIFASHSLQI